MGETSTSADDIYQYNREAWNAQVQRGNRWTVPVSPDVIERARGGRPEIVLTPQKQVPQEWFPALRDCPTLLLASGGGQQSPVMAAAGAQVTVVDLSEEQLKQDQAVADREQLSLRTLRASMDDLSALPAASFDLVIHPCSNAFVPDVRRVWREVARVTRSGGWLLAGFCNPLMFLFDEVEVGKGNLEIRYPIPYADGQHLPADRVQSLREQREPFVFGHSLSDQLGGQLAAGFVLYGMYEDHWGTVGGELAALDAYTPSFIATRSQRV